MLGRNKQEATYPMIGDGAGAPLFVLSFRYRDELAQTVMDAGWHAIAARRDEGVERRLLAAGAEIAVVDARGAIEQGLDAIARLAGVIERNRGALLAILSRRDVTALDRVFAAGATHYLVNPFGSAELGQALRFARRHVERIASPRTRDDAELTPAWRWRPGGRSVTVEPGWGQRLAEPGVAALTRGRLMADLDRTTRRVALRAIARLLHEGGSGAFACAEPMGEGRLAHHLAIDPVTGEVVGRIEALSAGRPGEEDLDLLTGLLSAPAGRARLGAALAVGGATAILVSLSRFDAINAAFGRSAGDALLGTAARRLARGVAAQRSDGAFACRLAGAEFLTVLPAMPPADALLRGQTLLDTVGRPSIADHHQVALAAHAAVAVAIPGEEPEHLLRRLSLALADAREGDGERVRLASELDERATSSRLEVDLRRALDEDRIDILFQPQVAVPSGQIVGVEALARWRHPERGEIDAATLFTVASRSDYTLQLSQHIQRRALAEAARWPDALGGIRVAINVTAADVGRPNFVAETLNKIRGEGIDPRRVTVELTEESLVDDLAAAAGTLAALRAAGLRTAIDDFGTGYSNLAYLKALPLDYLKIDRSLVGDIARAHRDQVVVRGVIDLARSLDLQVIAEGVETPDQLALLAAAGCNLYQGFLCAGPLDSAGLQRLLLAEPSF